MRLFLFAFIIAAGGFYVVKGKDIVARLEQRATEVTRFEFATYELNKENRKLKSDIEKLKYDMKALEAKNSFLEIKLGEKQRSVASVKVDANDLVQYDIYKWSVKEMISVAQKEYKNKNFEKSSQFYHSVIEKFSKDKLVTPEIIYQSGMASFKAKKYDWTIQHMNQVVTNYPTSKFFRGAKLWSAMAHHEQGSKDKFFSTVEEFRLKYRNTDEWKILSKHYENFYQKYK